MIEEEMEMKLRLAMKEGGEYWSKDWPHLMGMEGSGMYIQEKRKGVSQLVLRQWEKDEDMRKKTAVHIKPDKCQTVEGM